MSGRATESGGLYMQHVALTMFDKERCAPFFDNLTNYFHEHHHSAEQDAEGYEELLYLSLIHI